MTHQQLAELNVLRKKFNLLYLEFEKSRIEFKEQIAKKSYECDHIYPCGKSARAGKYAKFCKICLRSDI